MAAACVLLAATPHQPLAAADYTRYHSYDDMTAALRELAKTHSTLARLVEVAKTREGRVVWAIEIANSAGTPVAERPALLVAANFEGDQLIGSELALYRRRGAADRLRVEPHDQAAARLARVLHPAARESGRRRADVREVKTVPQDERDPLRRRQRRPRRRRRSGGSQQGRLHHVMRVKDPKGPYMVHPDDARLMRRADAQRGEAGGWTPSTGKGTDNDGDGFFNEDGPGGVDLNRNFQHQYPYYTPDAGPHMVSEPESRAVMDYMLKRRNVAAILTFGESDNLITAPTRRGALAPPRPRPARVRQQSVADGPAGRRVPRPAAAVLRWPRRWRWDDDAAGGRGAAGGGRGQPAPTPPATTVATQRRRVLPHDQRSLSRS